jgi:hypothetical protein
MCGSAATQPRNCRQRLRSPRSSQAAQTTLRASGNCRGTAAVAGDGVPPARSTLIGHLSTETGARMRPVIVPLLTRPAGPLIMPEEVDFCYDRRACSGCSHLGVNEQARRGRFGSDTGRRSAGGPVVMAGGQEMFAEELGSIASRASGWRRVSPRARVGGGLALSRPRHHLVPSVATVESRWFRSRQITQRSQHPRPSTG